MLFAFFGVALVRIHALMLSVQRGFPSGASSGFPVVMRGFSFVAARGFRTLLIAYFGRLRKVSHTNGHHAKRHNPAVQGTLRDKAAPRP